MHGNKLFTRAEEGRTGRSWKTWKLSNNACPNLLRHHNKRLRHLLIIYLFSDIFRIFLFYFRKKFQVCERNMNVEEECSEQYFWMALYREQINCCVLHLLHFMCILTEDVLKKNRKPCKSVPALKKINKQYFTSCNDRNPPENKS